MLLGTGDEQNGVAERLNRVLMEAARCMISHAKLNSNYWGEAVATAAYVRNRTTTKATNIPTRSGTTENQTN